MNKKLYGLMDWPRIEGIIYSEEDHPHEILGAKKVGGQTLLQVFKPAAFKVSIKTGSKIYEMEKVDEGGFFAVLIPEKEVKKYLIQIYDKNMHMTEEEDPYYYKDILKLDDLEKFHSGIHYKIYNILGAHPRTIQGTQGVQFAIWAPNAVRVSVVGDFNEWDGRIHPMNKWDQYGVFELFIPAAHIEDCYKFELKLKGGLTYLKSDPYAFSQQLRPDTASVISDISNFQWEDDNWIKNRQDHHQEKDPMSIYELHLSSFARPTDGREFYNYKELAPMIIEYVTKMNYTHIELMPIMEHPLDASWGYQVIGYFAPTARYGTPEDFMYFMNEMHKAGIGVILDWVPAHFPRDIHGLSSFDGTCLYEHQDPRQGYHPHWGTLIFNYGRPQVSNYLIANALFWIEQYHADGIRMDAVASMLYLDYGKNDGEWVANIYGGNENLEAVEFIKHLNSMVKKIGKGAITIAEESTAWPQITGRLENDGLGFDFKWNMGWMNDYLAYIKYDPYFRYYHHNELTFSMIYTYSEHFILVFSHDEVVHGKGSMISKMPGELRDKFMNLKLTYAYMMVHPGRKLIFMGQDIGEFDEWSETRQIQWNLLEFENHKTLNSMVADLNSIYKKYPALYQLDNHYDGFTWINSIMATECMLVFTRNGFDEEDTLLVVCNFANVERNNFQIGVPYAGKYKEIFNTDHKKYGGTNCLNIRMKNSVLLECDSMENSIKVNVAPLSISIFSCVAYSKEEKKEMEVQKKEQEKEKKKLAARTKKEDIVVGKKAEKIVSKAKTQNKKPRIN